MSENRVAGCLAVLVLALSACTKSGSSVEEPQAPAAYEGFQDTSSCETITGWAWDSHRQDQPVKVNILDGDAWLVTVVADQPRADLVEAKKGNGRHAFTVKTPAALKDGRPHAITIRFGTGSLLAHSPQTITCTVK